MQHTRSEVVDLDPRAPRVQHELHPLEQLLARPLLALRLRLADAAARADLVAQNDGPDQTKDQLQTALVYVLQLCRGCVVVVQ